MPAIPVLAAVGGAVGATGAMAVVVGGAIIGAAVGAVVAAVTGGDILKGALMGGLVGAAGGALLGAAPAAGGLAAAGTPAATGYGAGLVAPAATTAATTAVPTATAGLTATQQMGMTAITGAASAYADSQSEEAKLEALEADRAEDAAIRNTPIANLNITDGQMTDTSVDPRVRYDQTIKDLTAMVATPKVRKAAVEKPQISAPGALDVV